MRFLSCEPLLDDIGDIDLTGIHWAIVGGESGAQARVFDLARARKAARKDPIENGWPFRIGYLRPNGKRDLHGVCQDNFPAHLNVQNRPVKLRHLLG